MSISPQITIFLITNQKKPKNKKQKKKQTKQSNKQTKKKNKKKNTTTKIEKTLFTL
jgi:hypothetical protein